MGRTPVGSRSFLSLQFVHRTGFRLEGLYGIIIRFICRTCFWEAFEGLGMGFGGFLWVLR